MPADATFSIADLARLTGLNVRTIRYYLAQGLIPPSGESGPGAHYGAGHLDRLTLTKRLQQQHLPLAEIRTRLASLTDEEVAELVARPGPAENSVPTSALEYIRGLLGQSGGESLPDQKVPPRPAFVGPAPAGPPVAPDTHGFVPPPRLGKRAGMRGGVAAEAEPHATPDHEREVASLAEVPVPHETQALHETQEFGSEAPAALARRRDPGSAAAMPRMRDTAAARMVSETLTTPLPARRDPSATAPRERDAGTPERSQWERHALGQNIELHVRRPLSRVEQRRVERLITIARQVLKEDGV